MKKKQLGRVILGVGVACVTWGMSGCLPSQASSAISTPLGTCADAIRQPFSTTTYNSTALSGNANSTIMSAYSDDLCATPVLLLPLPYSSAPPFALDTTRNCFNICSGNGSIWTLGALCCNAGAGAHSIAFTTVATDTVPAGISTTGSCITCQCGPGGSFQSWALAVARTLAL